MASSAKRKTTMAKRDREMRLRERRMHKQAKKDARKLAAAEPEQTESDDTVAGAEISDDASAEAPPQD